jgi:hypothetical protein
VVIDDAEPDQAGCLRFIRVPGLWMLVGKRYTAPDVDARNPSVGVVAIHNY